MKKFQTKTIANDSIITLIDYTYIKQIIIGKLKEPIKSLMVLVAGNENKH